MENKIYIAIDLKSFYASVECVEMGRDPLTTNLVVADKSRTDKTICLAVTPALKSFGVPGRPRLFEVVQKVAQTNAQRLAKANIQEFSGKSDDLTELNADPTLEIDYIVTPPRMAHYIDYSTKIYEIYLKYVAPEDMHVYSIDEVFMDVTHYLKAYKMTPRQLAMKIILDVLHTTGITATAGIGTNLFLCKVAMDVTAKRIPPDKNGVRIAQLNEQTFRQTMWSHMPLTDFWRIGPGISKKLEAHGMFTLGDVARCSVKNEDALYKLFGINAELLIDHAWGWEPCTIADIKAYKPQSNSVSSGQVLQFPYEFEKARLVTREMTELLVLDLVDKGLVTDQMTLTVGYDVENISNTPSSKKYDGEIIIDRYGRQIPKYAHGTANLGKYSSSTREIMQAITELYNKIVDKKLTVRRITVAANRVLYESNAPKPQRQLQLDLFTDADELEKQEQAEEESLKKEQQMQKAMLSIKKRFGKNAILRGMNLEEGATAKDRNSQIGGHKA